MGIITIRLLEGTLLSCDVVRNPPPQLSIIWFSAHSKSLTTSFLFSNLPLHSLVWLLQAQFLAKSFVGVLIMFTQFYVLSPRGDTIVFRNFRSEISRSTAESFFRNVRFWNGKPQEVCRCF